MGTVAPEPPVSASSHRTRGISLLGRLLPSIGDFAWLLPVVFLFGRMGGVKTLIGDGDTGWHIRTGEWILAHGRLPRQDIFSFTKPGQLCYSMEWLSDVVMGWLHQIGGMSAVLLGAIVLLCLTSALLYRLIHRKSGSVLIAFALTAACAGGSAIHWLARPHLFTMLFVVVFYSILEERRPWMLFLLPPITILWTNLHGGFFVGMVLIGAYAAEDLIGALLAKRTEERQSALRRAWRYCLAGLGCLAATFVNPYSWRLHAYIFNNLSNPANYKDWAEFASISFWHPLAFFFELILLLGAATALWCVMRRRFASFLLIAAWAHLALLSTRNIPLFMIVSAPPIGLALAEWLRLAGKETAGTLLGKVLGGFESLSGRLNAIDAVPRWHIAGPAAILVLGVMLYRPAPPPAFQAEYDPQRYPAQALSVLRSQDRIFSTDVWGGYLIYRRYPEKVFIDGRADFYGLELERQYAEVMAVRYTWESILASYRVDTILLPVDWALTGVLKSSRNWRPVYDDGIAIVFRTNETGVLNGIAGHEN